VCHWQGGEQFALLGLVIDKITASLKIPVSRQHHAPILGFKSNKYTTASYL
jgi:hypothetical protein